MIYTKKPVFKIYLIFSSILIGSQILFYSIMGVFMKSWEFSLCMSLFWLFFYIIIIIVAKFESKSKRNYIKINDDSIDVKFENFEYGKEINVKYSNIISIKYFKATNIKNWFYIIPLLIPKIAYLKYNDNGKVVEKPFGYFELKDIIDICNKKNISLIFS